MRKDQLHNIPVMKNDHRRLRKDIQREEYIKAWGIKILRFKNEEVVERLNTVLNRIRDCLK